MSLSGQDPERVIWRLKEDGLLIRQIERATGISRGTIVKILTKKKRPFVNPRLRKPKEWRARCYAHDGVWC